ncbi:MAG: DUF1194 domain-containing protein [Pseudomonadota bacterium]
MIRRLVLAAAFLALTINAPSRAAGLMTDLHAHGGPAAQAPVDLELVLLADASGSIDDREIAFQRRGYAQAIRDPRVLDAIRYTGFGRIALTYVEWADVESQQVVVDWRIIETAEDAEAFAEALMIPPRLAWGRNAIGAALLKARALIEENGIEATRRVVDFSADSANNWNGPSIAEGRRALLEAGITINGLAVLCRDCSGRPVGYDLEGAFNDRIVGGPGHFVVTADSEATFANAVRRKLVLEIAGLRPGERRLAAAGVAIGD